MSDQASCVIILNFTQVIVGGEGLIICFMIVFHLLFQYVLKATFPEFMMFYWKVHLNFHFHNIAYQFSVKRNSFKTLAYGIGYFILQNKTTDQMAQSSDVTAAMLMSVSKFFKKCAITIDCTEVFIDT